MVLDYFAEYAIISICNLTRYNIYLGIPHVLQNKSPNVFFDVQKVLPNVLSKDDWCYLYRDQVYPFIDEEIFRELYPSETGRPNTPIKKAVSILIFMDMERHTWRGAEFLQTRRID